MQAVLGDYGIENTTQAIAKSATQLEEMIGDKAAWLYRLLHGVDSEPVRQPTA